MLSIKDAARFSPMRHRGDDTPAMEGLLDFFRKKEDSSQKNLTEACKALREKLRAVGETFDAGNKIKLGNSARWLCLNGRPVDSAEQVASELSKSLDVLEGFSKNYISSMHSLTDQALSKLIAPQLNDGPSKERLEEFDATAKRYFPQGLEAKLTSRREHNKAMCKASDNLLGDWWVIDVFSGHPGFTALSPGVATRRDPKTANVKDAMLRPYNQQQIERILMLAEKAAKAVDDLEADIFREMPQLSKKVVAAHAAYDTKFPKWESASRGDPVYDTMMYIFTLDHYVGDQDQDAAGLVTWVHHSFLAAVAVCEMSLKRYS